MILPTEISSRASPDTADPDAPVLIGTRLSAFIQTQLQDAQRHLARKGLARHQGIHDARKCIRRAKAALAIGRSVFGARGKRLNAELGGLCRGLSPLRDAQALVEVLQRLQTDVSGPLQSILPQAESLARQRRERMMAAALARDPLLMGRRQRLQRLSKRLQRLEWHLVGADEVAASLKRTERRLEKAAKRVARRPDDNDVWHDYRRRLRRLRQQATLLSSLGIDGILTASSFKAQTDALGEAQDDVLLMRLCGSRSPFMPEHRRLLRRSARQRLFIARGKWMPLY